MTTSKQRDYHLSRQMLSFTIMFFWASEYCHAPYFTPYLQTLGFAATTIGFLTGAYGFTQMCVRIPLGMATDAFGSYRQTILLGTVLTTLSSFGLIFATDLVPILICRVLAGLAASTWLAFTVLYNAYYKAEESVQAMTNVNAYNNAGKLIAFVIGMVTSSIWGYKVPLVGSFLTGLVAIFFALRLKPIQLKRESFQLSHVVSTIKTPAVLVAALFAIVMQFFMQGTVFSFTSAVAKEIHASAFEIGLATVLYTVVQVAGAGLIGKKLLTRLNMAQSVTIGCVLLAISGAMVGLSTTMWTIYLGQMVAGVGNLILSAVLMSMVVRYIPQERHSTAMGLYQAIYGLGMSAGPVVVGRLVSSGTFSSAYLIVAGMMAVSALVAPFLVGWADRASAANAN